ncbi:hypothetical protein PINS_up004958 [Pythium insidiosum]|nr:hypothetical protein PINS_up004958 [Pythium insidiosum]
MMTPATATESSAASSSASSPPPVTWLSDEDKHENHWRRTFCQIPFPSIYEHAENGKRSLHRLVSFFHRKADAERHASDALRSVLHTPPEYGTTANLEDLEEPGTSVHQALAEVKRFVDALCHHQVLLAKVLEEQVAEPLMSLQEASEMYIRTLQGEIRNVNDAYNEALDTHAAAAQRFRRASEELHDAQERQRIALHGIGVPAFELQRLAQRVARCEDEKAQSELSKAQSKTLLYNRIVARDEMAMAVSVAYQRAEEERLDQLQSCLKRFLHIEKERLRAAEKMLSSMEGKIEAMHRAEDIQLLIHNHRNPDNMHFQGKALALLDWHWTKTLAEEERHRSHHHHHHRHDDDVDRSRPFSEGTSGGEPMVLEPIEIPAPASTTSVAHGHGTPRCALLETPMGQALHALFAKDSQPNTPTKPRTQGERQDEQTAIAPLERCESGSSSVSSASASVDGDGDADADADTVSNTERALETELSSVTQQLSAAAVVESPSVQPETSSQHNSLAEVVHAACATARGRALFVRCLSRQRSLETRVADDASFDALVSCFHVFLDFCVRDDDVKAAKTAMILAETFYAARSPPPLLTPSPSAGDDLERRERGESWGSAAPHVLSTRGAARRYLQEEVKKHTIWKNPSFWEKALLLALGEELHKSPQPCAWEDLPSGPLRRPKSASSLASSDVGGSAAVADSLVDALPTREEAVSRVHNIVFGQLGSFTLSMLEFDVPFRQIESFVETMCDAYELTEDQRFLLRKNLQEIFTVLK